MVVPNRRSVLLSGPLTLLVLVAVLLSLACTPGSDFDRDAAVRTVVELGEGAFTEDQAGCYVDRVVDELGSPLLAEDAKPAPAQLDRLTSIRIDCAGVASIGRSKATTRSIDIGEEQAPRSQPMRRGDNIQMDLLWDRCEAGEGLACDQLFDIAPIGSDYEEFGYTCGHRTQELRCADRYATRRSDSSTTLAPVSGEPAP